MFFCRQNSNKINKVQIIRDLFWLHQTEERSNKNNFVEHVCRDLVVEKHTKIKHQRFWRSNIDVSATLNETNFTINDKKYCYILFPIQANKMPKIVDLKFNTHIKYFYYYNLFYFVH